MCEKKKFEIRRATKEDMYQVFDYVWKLAAFGKFEDQVKTTPEQYIKDGFESEPPAFICFVAVVDERVVGFGICFNCYSTCLGNSIFLEDLYIHPDYQRMGIGRELVLAVAKVGYDAKKRVDFHVLSWNSAKKFYFDLGAVNARESHHLDLYRLSEESLNKLFSNNADV